MNGWLSYLLTGVGSVAIAALGEVAVGYVKRVRPKLVRSLKGSEPIELSDGRWVCADVITLTNPSTVTIKDVTLKVKRPAERMRNGGIEATEGLDYNVAEMNGGELHLLIPFLKGKEYLSLTAVTEGKFRLSDHPPDVTVRSPDPYKLVEEGRDRMYAVTSSSTPTALLGLAIGIGVAVVGYLVLTLFVAPPPPVAGAYAWEPAINLTVAASVADVPELVSVYALKRDDVTYGAQGAYAYSLAKTNPQAGRLRLRRFLDVLLKTTRMETSSRANLCFFAGKISQLVNDQPSAAQWFAKASKADASELKSLESLYAVPAPGGTAH